MNIVKIEILPEIFKKKRDRFEFTQKEITEEFKDNLVSSIFLSQTLLNPIAKNIGQFEVVFKGRYSNRLFLELRDNPLLKETFNIKYEESPVNIIEIISPETEFLFNPETKQSKPNKSGNTYRYFIKIEFF